MSFAALRSRMNRAELRDLSSLFQYWRSFSEPLAVLHDGQASMILLNPFEPPLASGSRWSTWTVVRIDLLQ